ncbi:MAG: copper amine oxidase N-terminal domain-containing protein [Acidobacteriota bacterium]|nr:copper amine oxidase N-terminal domain-containing protein [Acidobacteriota bacterium]
MNQEFAEAAVKGVTNPKMEKAPGFCCRFVRQVTESAYEGKYANLFGASAIITADNFVKAGLAQLAGQAGSLEPGDILFKKFGSGPFGHVGIFVSSDKGVASNSSTQHGRVQGAKGYRTLAQFGHFDFVGRIPASDTDAHCVTNHYVLFLNKEKVAVMPVQDGVSLCPVREWALALGLDLDWSEQTQRVLLNGKEVPSAVTLIDDHAYIALTDLVAFSGLKLTTDDARHMATVTRS